MTAYQARQHLALVREVVVDEAGRHLGFVCDRSHGRTRKALSRKGSGERCDQLSTTLFAKTSTSHRLVVHTSYRNHAEVMANLSSIPWPDVIAVGIRTTGEGPFTEDVFWHFALSDGSLEVPGECVDSVAFDEIGARLPGLDHAKIIRAMGSTQERMFRVWHREESRFGRTREELATRFRALVRKVGGNPDVSLPSFNRLYEAWAAPSRRYHEVEHLADCLRELDAANAPAPTADIAELALWYHDVVYEPGRGDCEERSAVALLADAVTLAIPAASATAAASLVRATAHAQGRASGTPAVDLVLDVDLSILGRDPLRFMDYEYGVEEEYSPASVISFRCARGRFLAGVLERAHIFQTEHFRSRYEERARAQIKALLASPRYRSYRWLRWVPHWAER